MTRNFQKLSIQNCFFASVWSNSFISDKMQILLYLEHLRMMFYHVLTFFRIYVKLRSCILLWQPSLCSKNTLGLISNHKKVWKFFWGCFRNNSIIIIGFFLILLTRKFTCFASSVHMINIIQNCSTFHKTNFNDLLKQILTFNNL